MAVRRQRLTQRGTEMLLPPLLLVLLLLQLPAFLAAAVDMRSSTGVLVNALGVPIGNCLCVFFSPLFFSFFVFSFAHPLFTFIFGRWGRSSGGPAQDGQGDSKDASSTARVDR